MSEKSFGEKITVIIEMNGIACPHALRNNRIQNFKTE